jgi:hybrid cluster-associated redox disulfide protein
MVKKIIKKTSKKPVAKLIKPISKKKSDKIKKTMLITEITGKYPECAMIMMTHGLYCVGCGVAMYETLEDGAKAHGMSDLEIDSMVKEMNSVVNKR